VDLVLYHLLVQEMATKRDLTDPATSESVAAVVRTTQNLTLLATLTRADAAATGPAAWSEWKAGLISELVGRTQAILAGEPLPTPPELEPEQAALARRPGVAVAMVNLGNGVIRVDVAADDRVGILGVIAGVLAVNRLAVRTARTVTLGSRAVTEWIVHPEFGEAPALELLRQDVSRALAGAMDIEGRLRTRAAAYRRASRLAPPDPTVTFVPEASARATVMEVRAHDAPGLLHTIATAIAATNVSIDAAQAATLGSDAVDVFYLTAHGAPLTSAAAAELGAVVLRTLAPTGG
jgi:[protein-PII] uridylyltransferase